MLVRTDCRTETEENAMSTDPPVLRRGPAGATTDLSVLAALADPTRWQLLDTIAAHGGTTATVLAADLPVTRQAVVKHLGVLERVGLVSGRRAGREMRYSVRVERLDEAARWISEAARRWDDRLAALKRMAEADPPAGDAERT
jgi:DNA-binding transcriptional ArsR family regulator